jgi:hypothetical protein
MSFDGHIIPENVIVKIFLPTYRRMVLRQPESGFLLKGPHRPPYVGSFGFASQHQMDMIWHEQIHICSAPEFFQRVHQHLLEERESVVGGEKGIPVSDAGCQGNMDKPPIGLQWQAVVFFANHWSPQL